MRNPSPHGGPPAHQVPRAVTSAGQTLAAPVGGTWTAIGPSSTTGGQIAGGGNVSGRIYAVVPDRSDTTGRTLYAGAALGGVWKTTNKGASWFPLTDSASSLAITALVVDHQRIFAATGDLEQSARNFGSGSKESPSYFGVGILYSSNGGSTWKTIGANELTGKVIVDLDLSSDGSTLYVAGSGFWTATEAVGGAWHFTLHDPGGWSSVRVNPGNADLVNLGRWDASDGGPYVYTPSTGVLSRATWNGTSQPHPNVDRTAIAVDPKLPNNVYASLACASNCPQFGNGTAGWWGIYRSTDYGVTFSPFVVPANLPGAMPYEFFQGDWDLSIAVDPVDDFYVYFGLVNLWSYSYHTTPNTISNISSLGANPPDCNWWPDRYQQSHGGIHCDQNSIAFDAAGTLYSGNDGGVFASPPPAIPGNPRSEWLDLNSNLGLTQFYQGVSYNPANPNRLLGGTQDNGTQTWNGSSWQVTDAGDGGATLIDPSDPSNTWFDSWVTLCVSRTRNGSAPWTAVPGSGPTWTRVSRGFTLNPNGLNPTCSVLGALFIAPFAMDPSNPAVVLAGADRPYLTTNANAPSAADLSWHDISGTTFFPSTRSISATTICPDPSHNGIFFLGTNDGYVVKSSNGYSATPAWFNDSANLPGQWITRIVCGRDGSVYATVGGSQTVQGTHVLRQAQGSATWTSIQGNLPNTTVTSLIEDSSSNPPTLFVSTDLGVFRSVNGGGIWERFGRSLPNVPVSDMAFDQGRNLLYAFTFGRGVWQMLTVTVATGCRWTAGAPAAGCTGGWRRYPTRPRPV